MAERRQPLDARAHCGDGDSAAREAGAQPTDATVDRIIVALEAIFKRAGTWKRGRGADSGSFDCPNQCGGVLTYSRAASNGHLMARCSTPGCARFMQ